MSANGYSELVDVSLYRTLAWFDEELEAHSLSSGIFTRLSLTYRVLSDIESEKRETGSPTGALRV
jgi:hypothetical protein